MLLLILSAFAATDPRGLAPAWTVPIPAGQPGAPQVADVDGDGLLDVILPHPTPELPGQVLVIRQGPGTTVQPTLTLGTDRIDELLPASPGTWGDLNGDGRADQLLWTGDAPARERQLLVRPGTPTGPGDARALALDDGGVPFRFGDKVPIGPAVDLDGDGFHDVLLRAHLRDASSGEQHLAVHKGSAEGLVRASVWETEMGGEGFVDAAVTVVGDIDADGFRDLVVLDLYAFDDVIASSITLTRGDEDGFRDAYWTSIALPDTVTRLDGFQVMDAGDMDGNGLDDVLLLVTPDDPAVDASVLLFHGDPNYGFTFNSPTVLWTGPNAGVTLIGAGDLDGDGLRDLAVGTPDGRLVAVKRDALGYVQDFPWLTWTAPETEPGFGRRGAFHDLTADGRDDLVLLDDTTLSLFPGFADADLDGADDDVDCAPANPEVFPGATEVWYDGTDQDCDGRDDDQDGDTHPEATDCNDLNPAVHPAAVEVWYDGTDQDCDGRDDDADADGFGWEDDCDDDDAARAPDLPEIPDDGIDQDCDGADLITVPEGCGCASTQSPTPLALLPLLLLARRRATSRPART